MQINPITLLELNRIIKKIVKEIDESYWIVAEISELKVNFSGHCYLELIQKDTETDQIVARSRATIWATSFRMIKPYFESTTKQRLGEGISVLVRVSVDFHELYGLSLNIVDIEPAYTIGDLALRKQKIIERLQEEGVFDMNKELEICIPGQRIAVISSKTAAGYEDFEDQLLGNNYGYKFYIKLFPAIMQGDEAEKSIIAALDKIYKHESAFDAVVIIRGGGSQADLNCFNSYWLAYHITQFPLPILTGIGHEQDDSVADLVAHMRLKTPTAVAAFLIDNMAEIDAVLQEIQEQLVDSLKAIIERLKNKLSHVALNLQNIIRLSAKSKTNRLSEKQHALENLAKRSIYQQNIFLIKTIAALNLLSAKIIRNLLFKIDMTRTIIIGSIKHNLDSEQKKLGEYNVRITSIEPQAVLKRGYSITLKNGKVLKDDTSLFEGDLLETILHKGKIKSIFKKK